MVQHTSDDEVGAAGRYKDTAHGGVLPWPEVWHQANRVFGP